MCVGGWNFGLDLSLQDGAVGDGAYLFMQCPYRFAVHRLLCAALSNLFQPQIGPVVNNWKLCGRGRFPSSLHLFSNSLLALI